MTCGRIFSNFAYRRKEIGRKTKRRRLPVQVFVLTILRMFNGGAFFGSKSNIPLLKFRLHFAKQVKCK